MAIAIAFEGRGGGKETQVPSEINFLSVNPMILFGKIKSWDFRKPSPSYGSLQKRIE
jgi:hypothetical protein